ncbi:MAG TPA: RidA family protein [Candidatus Hypogeohydataceae bacterium YC40]
MPEKQVISTPRAPQAIGPYSQVIRTEPFVFVSGQIPLEPGTGQLITGDIEAQTRQTLENLKAILEAAGSSLDKAVKTTIYLTRIEDYAAVNKVYSEYFNSQKSGMPARSVMAVAGLPRGAGVEIEAIALVGGGIES